MNIVIVDDEPMILNIIQKQLQYIHDKDIETYSFTSIQDMQKARVPIDLLLLDIDMPDCDGITYSKEHRDMKIIFVTSQGQRMKEAFGYNVYGFVEKDHLKEELCQKVIEVIKELKQERTIELKTDLGCFQFYLKDIVYGQYLSDRRISFVVNQKSYIYKGKTFKEFVEMLGDGFYFIDRDTFINMDHVIGIVNSQVILRDIHQKLIISSRRQKEVKDIFLRRKRK